MEDIIAAKNVVSGLMNMMGDHAHSSGGVNGVEIGASRSLRFEWMAPADRDCRIFSAQDFDPEQTPEDGSLHDVTEFKELGTKLGKLIANQNPSAGDSPTPIEQYFGESGRLFLDLAPLVPIDKAELGPADSSGETTSAENLSMEIVKQALVSEKVIVSIYSYSGFNFTSEYTRVYKGRFNSDNAYEDLLAITVRALRSLDPTLLSEVTLRSFGERIIQAAVLSAVQDHVYETCERVILNKFPHLSNAVVDRSSQLGKSASSNKWFQRIPGLEALSGGSGAFSYVKVYLGYQQHQLHHHQQHKGIERANVTRRQLGGGAGDSGRLHFTVRVRGSVTTNDPQRARAAEAGGTNTAAGGGSSPPPVATRADFVYYRDCALVAEEDAELRAHQRKQQVYSNAGNTDGRDKGSGGDISERVYLIVPIESPKEVLKEQRGKEVVSREQRAQNDDDDDGNNRSARYLFYRAPIGATPAGAASEAAETGAAMGLQELDRVGSICSELYAWGFDACFSMGIGISAAEAAADSASARKRGVHDGNTDDGSGVSTGSTPSAVSAYHTHSPRPVPLDYPIVLERVRMVACSARHTLLLTHIGGRVYSCGDNAEGALGSGNFTSSATFRPVEWRTAPMVTRPADVGRMGTTETGHVRIVKVAAGSGSIGSHSMAITERAELYAWGVAYATGTGTVGGTTRTGAKAANSAAVTTPTLVGFAHLPAPVSAARERDGLLNVDAARERAEGESGVERGRAPEGVVDVSCGDGFTVAVLSTGRVCSWGIWAHGRLGRGPIPLIQSRRVRHRASKRVARYQLKPALVTSSRAFRSGGSGGATDGTAGVGGAGGSMGAARPGASSDGSDRFEITDAVQVACGDAHTLLLLRSGHVLAWGQNSCGQIGCGPSCAGYLNDAFSPVLVPPFGIQQSPGMRKPHEPAVSLSIDTQKCFVPQNASAEYRALFLDQQEPTHDHNSDSSGGDHVRAAFTHDTTATTRITTGSATTSVAADLVCAGAFHSVVVDRQGRVWTWGARGSPCLGHRDNALLVPEWSKRVNSLFSISTQETSTMVPFELLKWTNSWSMPRRMDSILNIDIDQVCAGDFHTALRSRDGQFYLCGGGPAVPYFVPVSRVLDAIDDLEMEEEEEEDEEEESSEVAGAEAASKRSPIPQHGVAAIASAAIASEKSESIAEVRRRLLSEQTDLDGRGLQHSQRHGTDTAGSSNRKEQGSGRRSGQGAPERPDILEDSEKDRRNAIASSLSMGKSSSGGSSSLMVSSPLCPSASWLSEICTRQVRYIGGGSSRLFVLLDEETVSGSFTSQLLSLTQLTHAAAPVAKPELEPQNNGHINSNNSNSNNGSSSSYINMPPADVYDGSDLDESASSASSYSLPAAADGASYPLAAAHTEAVLSAEKRAQKARRKEQRDLQRRKEAQRIMEQLSFFEERGKADCMILASGKVFLCHKALLAHRSPVLREMITIESPSSSSSSASNGGGEVFSGATSIVQLMLPELNRDSARCLLHFLYRDTLPNWCTGELSTLNALARAGRTLRMPRLQLLCDGLLKVLHKTALDHISTTIYSRQTGRMPRGRIGAGSAGGAGGGVSVAIELPPPTLVRDLGSMVGDPEFADVRFIAEGRAIMAHRFILEHRCAYFRAMFNRGMWAESSWGADSEPDSDALLSSGARLRMQVLNVVVPDSFVGLLRVLIFLYTNTLPDGSDGALLEDLMAADRYGLTEMKVLCENMLVPSESNWVDLLRAADLLHSRRLHLIVVAFLRDNFNAMRDFLVPEIVQVPLSDTRDWSAWPDASQGGERSGPAVSTAKAHITQPKRVLKYEGAAVDESEGDEGDEGEALFQDTIDNRYAPPSEPLSGSAGQQGRGEGEGGTADRVGQPAKGGEGGGVQMKSVLWTPLQDLRIEFPELLDEVLLSRQLLFPLPPSHQLVSLSTTSETARDESIKQKQRNPTNIPLWVLAAGVVAVVAYQRLTTMISFGYMIPVVNFAAFVAFIWVGLGIMGKNSK